MSEDNQNQNPQDDRQSQGTDETLESRGTGSPASPQDQVDSGRQGSSPELEDADELDDEDRDEDSRSDGSPNRRNSIG